MTHGPFIILLDKKTTIYKAHLYFRLLAMVLVMRYDNRGRNILSTVLLNAELTSLQRALDIL